MPASKAKLAFRQCLAKWVKFFRFNREVTQEALAEHLQYSSRQIQKIERGLVDASGLFVAKFSASMKDDMREEFQKDLTAVTAREARIKPIRRSDSIL